MKSGLKKIKKDHRQYSFHRTFGGVGLQQIPEEFDFDAGLTNPNQELPNPVFGIPALPFGCTGYTSSELCQDEDKALYDPEYTYDKTRYMEGTQGQNVGCDIRDSLKSTIVYGVRGKDELSDTQAETHRRGAYFDVLDGSESDAFDSIRMAMWNQKRSISVGTPWYTSFSYPSSNAIVRAPTSYTTDRVSWHNFKICGVKKINGVLHLKAKPWLGPEYGMKGFSYFPREIINTLLTLPDTGAFTLAPYDPNNNKIVILTLYQTVLSYLRMILNSLV